MSTRQQVSQWLASRKFALTLAIWAIALIGGAYLCWKGETFDDKYKAVELSLEYSLYAFLGFVGVEGANDIIGRFKNKSTQKPSNEMADDSENMNAA